MSDPLRGSGNDIDGAQEAQSSTVAEGLHALNNQRAPEMNRKSTVGSLGDSQPGSLAKRKAPRQEARH